MADGILPSMICAKKASEVLVQFSKQNYENLDLSLYEKAWKDVIGKMFDDGHMAYKILMKIYFSEYILYQFMKILGKMYK